MSQFPHDQFAKNLLESLLSPYGQVKTALTLNSEVREIDVYFTPNANLSATSDLGLLAQCAANSAAFEPFRNPVTALEIRSCMSKLYDLHLEIIRQARREKQQKIADEDLPWLWIFTPTLAAPTLLGFGAINEVESWGSGVYLLPPTSKNRNHCDSPVTSNATNPVVEIVGKRKSPVPGDYRSRRITSG
ncbi:MAG: hypothetical protein KA716_14645 [Gloeotrichia echinulata DEX184]|nr:hypothetical protein [Gloeotrichia echinulata DEX184]